MTKSLTKMSAGIITMMALMGNAYAATTACPAVSDIKQTADGNGFSYTAAAPMGLLHPMKSKTESTTQFF